MEKWMVCPLFIILLDTYVSVINTSVTHTLGCSVLNTVRANGLL